MSETTRDHLFFVQYLSNIYLNSPTMVFSYSCHTISSISKLNIHLSIKTNWYLMLNCLMFKVVSSSQKSTTTPLSLYGHWQALTIKGNFSTGWVNQNEWKCSDHFAHKCCVVFSLAWLPLQCEKIFLILALAFLILLIELTKHCTA